MISRSLLVLCTLGIGWAFVAAATSTRPSTRPATVPATTKFVTDPPPKPVPLPGLVSLLVVPPLIGGFIVGLAGQDTEAEQMGITVVSHLSALLSGAITTPFVAAVTGLLYIDRRMRLEALDVTLLREAQSNPAPRI